MKFQAIRIARTSLSLFPLIILPLAILLILVPITADCGSLDIPGGEVGLSFGNSSNFTGLRFNLEDRDVERINGISFALWHSLDSIDTDNFADGPNPDAEYNGIVLCPVAVSGYAIRGVGAGLVGVSASELHGVGAGMLGVGADIFNGVGFGGLGVGGDKLTGIFFGGLGVGGDKISGLTIAGGMIKGRYLDGVKIAAICHAKKEMNGLSISLVNIAKNLHGLQFGLINIAKNNDGIFKVLPFFNMHR